MPTKAKTKPVAPKGPKRKHLEPKSEMFFGKNPLTAEKAKEMLGWKVVESGDYLFKDKEGNKILCLNNTKNRPFSEPWADRIAQDILNRHWRFNMESIIIGEYDQVISGQHRLVALVFASQLWELKKNHWGLLWKTEPTIEALVAYGCKETMDVIRTIDNVKARTLADTLFCDGTFADLSEAGRKQACRICDYALRFLWSRTGVRNDAFTPTLTHSEGGAFLERHATLKECVRHIFDEDKEKRIGKYLSPGYATACMYLMGVSGGDDDALRNHKGQLVHYADADPAPNEGVLDLSLKEKAGEFWTNIARVDPPEDFKILKTALAEWADPDTGSSGGRVPEKVAILCKAWSKFRADEPITKASIKLDMRPNEDGIDVLHDYVDFGGIDLGRPRDSRSAEKDRQAVATGETIDDKPAGEPDKEDEEEKDTQEENQPEQEEEPKADDDPKTEPEEDNSSWEEARKRREENVKKLREARERRAAAKGTPKPGESSEESKTEDKSKPKRPVRRKS